MQDQKKRTPEILIPHYSLLAFKASIMSQTQKQHTHTESERTGWWTRSSLGSFKTQNMINLECFCYPKQLQLNLDLPFHVSKGSPEPTWTEPIYPSQIYIVDIFGRPTVLEEYATTFVEKDWKGESAKKSLSLTLYVSLFRMFQIRKCSSQKLYRRMIIIGSGGFLGSVREP